MIKETREELGLTRQEAANIVEVPLRTWEKWERGERTPAPYIEKLIAFYLKHRDLE